MRSMIGIVQADPHFGWRCRLRRHERKLYPFNGLMVPWCQTCRLNQQPRVP